MQQKASSIKLKLYFPKMRVPSVFSPLKLVSVVLSLRTAYSLDINDTAVCIAHPDPHFTTFDGIHYDYQHGCDVVLIDSIALKIQLRLKKYQATSTTFSEIDRLAIHFQNGDTLEIDKVGNHFVNIGPANPSITSIGGFGFSKTSGAIQWVDKEYEIQLTPLGHVIKVMDLAAAAKGGGLSLFIEGHGSMFHDATGMCGKWNALAPGLHNRDGVDILPSLPPATVINGAIFGDLWQVTPATPHNDIEYISTTNLPYPPTLHSAYPATCAARRRLPEQERKLKSSPCDHCLTLNNLVQRANCEYDASVIGCWWTEDVPFYSKDDTRWYNKDDNCCLRRVNADEGYKYVNTTNISLNSFGIERCPHGNENGCIQKTPCSKNNCLSLRKCFNDDEVQCFREEKCFSACVQRTKVEQGYTMVPTMGPGYKYDKCDHNSDCYERKTCNGRKDKNCKLYKACDASGSPNKKLCFRDVKCSDPCSPTPSPTPIQTTNSPTCTGDAECFRHQRAVNGFTLVEATSSTIGAFSMDYTSCKSTECYQKKKCNFNSEDACFVLRECKGDGCFEEVLCGCVRKKEVNIGFRYEVTGKPGFVYKPCAHDENCMERVTCKGRNCGQLVDCRSVNLGCFEEIPCSSDCAPTSSPTKKTKSPTKVPTNVPTSSPTKETKTPTKVPTRSLTDKPTADQGDPWKCDGCQWMHKSGKVVNDNDNPDDFCKIVLRPKPIKSTDGRCKDIIDENRCMEAAPCTFKYNIQYRIQKTCKVQKMCNTIVADAYTAGASPPTPIVSLIKKKKGFITTEDFIEVKCQCKTHTKVFKVECTSKQGRVVSKSVELDYTCSECDMKWLAETK